MGEAKKNALYFLPPPLSLRNEIGRRGHLRHGRSEWIGTRNGIRFTGCPAISLSEPNPGYSRSFRQRGAYVAILDLNVEAGERIAKGIGAKALFVKCDTSSEQSVEAAIAASDSAFGDRAVGGVVHCAGVGSVASALNRDGTATSLDHFREVVEINLTGSFNVACSFAPTLYRIMHYT